MIKSNPLGAHANVTVMVWVFVGCSTNFQPSGSKKHIVTDNSSIPNPHSSAAYPGIVLVRIGFEHIELHRLATTTSAFLCQRPLMSTRDRVNGPPVSY
jgi:hypothetical protein